MPFPLHLHGSMPCKQQSDIVTVYQTHVVARLYKQIKHWLRKKKIEALRRKGLHAKTAFSKYFGAIGDLSFSKSCKCIHES
jgi:hypothetical protein